MRTRLLSGRSDAYDQFLHTYNSPSLLNSKTKSKKALDNQVPKSLAPSLSHTDGVQLLPRLCLSHRRVFAVMKNVGSLHEEMARQLTATGAWECVFVLQQCGMSQLTVSKTGEPMEERLVSLLLGEKAPMERFIASRRIRLALGNRSSGPASKESRGSLVVNYVEKTRCITLKGSMVSTLLEYYGYSWDILGEYLPVTFQLIPRQPKKDERHLFFLILRRSYMKGTYWIVKSSSGCHGENIKIFSNNRPSIEKMINFVDGQKSPHSWVVQLYLDRPLLYHKRKFDVRCWVLLCGENYELYVHEQLVMRMSSVMYTRNNITTSRRAGLFAHITNHCVQETCDAYALFEEGNELWRDHLDSVVRCRGRHLLERGIFHRGANRELEPSLENTILPQMYHIIVKTMLAARNVVPNSPPSTPCFQVFGYDFLIDDMLRVWLLEINGSPGVSAKLLRRIVTDTIEITLKPYFPDALKRLAEGKVDVAQRNGDICRSVEYSKDDDESSEAENVRGCEDEGNTPIVATILV